MKNLSDAMRKIVVMIGLMAVAVMIVVTALQYLKMANFRTRMSVYNARQVVGLSFSWPVAISEIAISPDGGQLAVAGLDGVWLYRDGSQRPFLLFEGHGESVLSVAWSPDGSMLVSGSLDGSVRIWDAATGKELRYLEGHESNVRSVAWSPDGSRLALV